MIACFDVHYEDDCATAAAILFEDWQDSEPNEELTIRCTDVQGYQPGSFYPRELKPLRKILAQINDQVNCFVIDAYCHLSQQGAPGLGAYFYELLPEDSVVIGVAKNRFRDTKHAIEVMRGESQKPLFVTAIGKEYSVAAQCIESMAGDFRIPTMLKAVDRLCRDG